MPFGPPRVQVSESRINRIDVGLRPFRPRGFRVEGEALGDKLIVHNYGHGGGGITLSWGTSMIAVRDGYDSSKPDCAVLGCGAVGLATARLLQEQGARVTIYAKDPPLRTASAVAGGQWWPSAVYEAGATRRRFFYEYVEAGRFAFSRFQTMLDKPGYGVSWRRNYVLSNSPIRNHPAPDDDPLVFLMGNRTSLRPGEHPFASRYVSQFDSLMVETPAYLPRMEADFRAAGGQVVVREFRDRAEIAALPERTIFNCTGLGAGALFGDAELTPIRGQLVLLQAQPDIHYNIIADGGLYMFSRSDGIVLGGTFEPGVRSMTPNPATVAQIVRRHRAMFDAMNA